MQDRRYLLNLEQLFAGNDREALFGEALDKVDQERRQKVLCMKNAGAQTKGLGAGLLLQKALADYTAGQPKEQPDIQIFSVTELLAVISRTVIEPGYEYGGSGKPYFKDYPIQFNLSHSGQYVFCGTSAQEIGVDIQELRGGRELQLARRYFSPGEYQALESCKDREGRKRLFFSMWTRKEAYGKMTGQGLAGAIDKDLRAGKCEEELVWEEYDVPAGYRIAVCKRRNILRQQP